MHIHPQPLRTLALLDAQHARRINHAYIAVINLTVHEQTDAANVFCCLQKAVTTSKQTAEQDGNDYFLIITWQH